ncbi:MAG TPA: hypothetical protein VGE37_13005, partial [Archangium sp.]
SDVELLSMLKEKAIAKTEAARLLKTCPQTGAAAATVLAGLGDSSWIAAVPRVFEDTFQRSRLERLLDEKWSAKLEAELRALPSPNGDFTTWRESMLTKSRR